MPNTERVSLQNRVTVNSQHRPMGWIDLTPGFNFSEEFIYSDTDSTTRRTSYNATLSSGTTLYGIFQPQIGRLRGIRHRFQPRINFNYNQSGRIFSRDAGVWGLSQMGRCQTPASILISAILLNSRPSAAMMCVALRWQRSICQRDTILTRRDKNGVRFAPARLSNPTAAWMSALR